MATRPSPWSNAEDILVVTDYLSMLQAQQRGEKINKAATRRALLPRLNNRSEASVEFKRCNISACLLDLGKPWLAGYRPASNYQKSLKDTVAQLLPAYAS